MPARPVSLAPANHGACDEPSSLGCAAVSGGNFRGGQRSAIDAEVGGAVVSREARADGRGHLMGLFGRGVD